MNAKLKTTDYYSRFKKEIADAAAPLYEKVVSLRQQVSDLTKKLDTEQATASMLKERMRLVKEKPLEFGPSGELEDIGNFKKAAMSLSSEIQATDLAVTSLLALMARKKTELDNAESTLRNRLIALMRSCRSVGDQNINTLLRAAFDELNAYIAAFQRIHADYEQGLVLSDETLIPGVLNMADIQDFTSRIERFNSQQANRSQDDTRQD